MNSFILRLAVSLLLAATACHTVAPSLEDANYNLFFSPEDHLTMLIQEQRIREADEALVANIDSLADFDPDQESGILFEEKLGRIRTSEGEPPLPRQLAELILTRIGPNAEAALAEVEHAGIWPTELAQWSTTKSAIKHAEDAIRDYDSYSTLRLYDPPPEPYALLQEKLTELKASIDDSRNRSFADYPLLDSPEFMSHYPVAPPANYLHSQEIVWRAKLRDLDPAQVAELYSRYEVWLNSDMRSSTALRHFEAHFDGAQNGRKPSLSELIAAANATREKDMPLKTIPNTRISVVEVTSRTLLEQGQIEFPTSIEVDLPFPMNKVEFDEAFKNPTLDSSDLVILIDVAAARVEREITEYGKVESQFHSNTVSEPNPQYNIAQNEVTNARMRVQRVAANLASINSQYCEGFGCLGKIVGQVAGIAAQEKAQGALKSMMQTLYSTPIVLDRKVYSPYQFQHAVINVQKEATINYYVIDRVNNTFMRDTLDMTQTQDFTVAYDLHEKDKNRYQFLSRYASDDDVVAFEESEVEFSLSSLLEQVDKSKTTQSRVPSLTLIKSEILKDKNEALAKFKSKQYEVVPDSNDPRFDHVVVIYHPGGGLGTGFFVREDVILTNFHVIQGTQFVEMKLFSGQETFGKVIAKDIRLDLALIKSQARGRPVAFYDSNHLALGQTVDVIGHPKGLEFSISRGVLSGMREIESRYMKGGNEVRFIQSDAAINPGNSGGPLFLGNKVVGVNTQKLAETDLEGLGFSIHYAEVLDFLEKENLR